MVKLGQRSLLELIAEPTTLERAWRKVRRGSPSSAGVDNITLSNFARNWLQEKKNIRYRLHSRTYNFSPYLGQPIHKKTNASKHDLKAWRPISIATVRDRVVQRAILDRIWTDIRSNVYIETSFGGIRPYKTKRGVYKQPNPESNSQRCVRAAVRRILDLRKQGYIWVFETDIENFFPTINRKKLFVFLRQLLRDSTIDGLIEAALDSSIANAQDLGKLAELWDPTSGVPKGGVLSPILANLYLYNHDKTLSELGFKLVRYVDDLVVLTKNYEKAFQAYEVCKDSLQRLELQIHPLGNKFKSRIKTQILSPSETFDFLGLTFTKNSVMPCEAKFTKLYERIDEITDVHTSQATLDKIVQELNWCMKGWVNAYRFCNLSRQDLVNIDNRISKRLRGWLVLRGIIAKPNKIDSRAYKWLGVESATTIRITPFLKKEKPSPINSTDIAHKAS